MTHTSIAEEFTFNQVMGFIHALVSEDETYTEDMILEDAFEVWAKLPALQQNPLAGPSPEQEARLRFIREERDR